MAASAPIVNTQQGPVQGMDDGSTSRFLGIPFAAPPLGALRFRPPQAPISRTTTLVATTYGPACPQADAAPTLQTSEDCLTLNVFRPDWNASGLRPVMVFLYGGSFKYGTAAPELASAGPDYDGGLLATHTGNIVVTLNYRLGALGFLASPVLDATDPRGVSGNYGLLDQRAALYWVARNAPAFGGDPHRVLLFGQSAGALSVVEQMVSPGAEGLFHAAEVESPGALPSETLADAETRDAPILAETGCSAATDQAACLRAVPVAKLLASGVPVGPNVDGTVIPTAPAQAIASGAFARVPTLVLSDRDEGTFFIADGVQALGHPLTTTGFALTLQADFGSAAAAAIEATYPLSGGSSPGQVLSSVLTDEFFACPAVALRDSLAQYVPVVEAEFSQADPIRDYPVPTVASIAPGDTHTSELAYVFGQDGGGTQIPEGSSRELSNVIEDALGDLARVTRGAKRGGLPSASPSTVLTLRSPPMPPVDFAITHRCAFWTGSGIAPKLIETLR